MEYCENDYVKIYNIEDDLVEELIELCKDNNLFNFSSNKISIFSYVCEDVGCDFSCEINRMFKNVFNAYINVRRTYTETDFQSNIIRYLNDEYNFDLYDYSSTYGYTIEEAVILFALSHELSHIIKHIDDLCLYNGYRQAWKDTELYNKCRTIENDKERFEFYRRIPSETIADMGSIKLLVKYAKEIKKIMCKGYITMDELKISELKSLCESI